VIWLCVDLNALSNDPWRISYDSYPEVRWRTLAEVFHVEKLKLVVNCGYIGSSVYRGRVDVLKP